MIRTLKKLGLFVSTVFLTSPIWADLPYFPIQFPRDEAAHYTDVPYTVSTMSEWWYYNGKIVTSTGRKFGYYLSYNYMQLDLYGKKFTIPLFFIQLTDMDNKKVYGRMVALSENDAHFSTKELAVSFGNDISLQKSDSSYLLEGSTVSNQGNKLKFSINLTPTHPPLYVGGKTGLMEMWNNTNSYYYTYTQMKTSGYIQLDDEKFTIDPQQSLSWMDHQWGDFLVLPQTQWIWFGIQLDNGISINLPNSIDTTSKLPIKSQANIMMPDGSTIYTNNVTVTPKNQQGPFHFPQYYEVSIPSLSLNVALTSSAQGQDTNWLWEGISDVDGLYNGQAVKGYAYAENTVKY